MKISLSFDVEPDLHTGAYRSITEGIPRILHILNKHNVRATFFTTCDCIEKYPKIFQNMKKQGHEIALHGYRHKRFDDLSLKEKEEQITKALSCFKKYLKQYPAGFRAPQDSIDKPTLDLLETYKFKYDSSYTPLNLLQLLFFPKRLGSWFKQFFSSVNIYKIRKNLYEVPLSSLFFPFVSLVFRAFPKSLIILYFNILKLFHRNIIFYAHSWDFIDIPQSRIDRKWPKENLIRNLDYFLDYSARTDNYCNMKDLLK